jgi:hypothetical protein
MRRKRTNDGTDITSTLYRQWEYMKGAPQQGWKDGAFTQYGADTRFNSTHLPCGTVVSVKTGGRRVCPKCEPEKVGK